ncbi:xylulokinase [Halanaerobium hydrogeniformans]|uniref:Carbohydrate kinase, FGGY-like protein n=1 Tax=Halanaerobium hydrogeniformans TaxID=656519 RepID=E4RM32_HALHG|nr:FGGY family carbohydrate kinase [Halanaerobium hydrogeniformans]ADQ14115.1 Carbohydrate kinase, FGGY-like protein [Halanaerobium hydrogeniformans]
MSDEKYLLSFDIGSTAVKLIIFDKKLKVVYKAQKAVPGYQEDGFQYQKAEDWWEIIIELSHKMLQESSIDADEIAAVSSTGQMEDCLLLDQAGKPLTEVLLYSDGRAKKQYQFLVDKYSQKTLNKMTANQFDVLMSINKYLWLRENRKETFKKHRNLILGAKDYLNFKLTGKNVSDYTNASTTGFLAMEKMEYNQKLIKELNFEREYLPELKTAEEIIGTINAEAAAELWLQAGTKVINGSGDVGASTLGAGALKVGDIYCYLGTTGWLAMPSEDISENKNLFTLSNTRAENYIIAGAVLNAGQAYDWFLSKIMNHQEIDEEVYKNAENKLSNLDSTKNQSIFIPYINGERSPLKVSEKSGVFARLGANSDSWQLLEAVLEGVSFSLKHNLIEMTGSSSLFDKKLQLNLIGGGSKSKIWPQMLADILESRVNVLDLEVGAPSLGAAMIALKALGEIDGYGELRENFKITKSFEPQSRLKDHYQQKYENYIQLVNKIF